MKKVRIKTLPKADYGGQRGFGLDTRNTWVRPEKESTPIVNSTIGPVPVNQANVEAERGESILGDFDGDGMMEHFKIGGKPHSQGGTPITAPDGSFIFSDTKKMAIGGKFLELFGKNPDGKKKYTPAQLAKQYDINSYKTILEDKTIDPIKKKTAQMMIDNNTKKLGELAFIQESIKNFPQGVPNVAEQTMGQYKFGGYIPMAQDGMKVWLGDKYENKGNKSRYTPEELSAKVRSLGYEGPDDIASIQSWIYQNNGDIVKDYHKQYGPTKAKKEVDGKWGYRWDAILDNISTPSTGQKPIVDMERLPTYTYTPNPQPVQVPVWNNPMTPITKQPIQDKGTPFDYRSPDKLAMANSLYNLASIKKYTPWEAPITSVTPTPTFYDPTRELAANSEMANQNMMANNLLAGPGSQFRNSGIQGQAASNAADIIGKYANMNTQVANTFAGVTADITNQTLAQQRNRVNSLYDKNVIANQQYDNAKRDARNAFGATYQTAWENRQKTDTANQLAQYFYSDPQTGRMVFRSEADKQAFLESVKNTGSGDNFNNMVSYYQQLEDKYGRETATQLFKTMFSRETPVNPR